MTRGNARAREAAACAKRRGRQRGARSSARQLRVRLLAAIGFSLVCASDAASISIKPAGLLLMSRALLVASDCSSSTCIWELSDCSSGTCNQVAEREPGPSGNYVGESVAVNYDGSVFVAGGTKAYNDQGRVVAYAWDGTGWTTRFKMNDALLRGDSGSSDRYGGSVALSADGSILAIGARYAGGASHGVPGPGRVKVLRWEGGRDWSQRGGTLSGDANDDNFGISIALSASGSSLVVGAPNADAGGNSDAGIVRGACAISLSFPFPQRRARSACELSPAQALASAALTHLLRALPRPQSSCMTLFPMRTLSEEAI